MSVDPRCTLSALQADKDLYAGLFKELGASLSTAPDAVSVPLLGYLAEAQLMVSDKLGAQAPKLPDQVNLGGKKRMK